MQQARPSVVEGVPADPESASRWADHPHDVLRALIQEAQSGWLSPMAAAWTQEDERHTAELAALQEELERCRAALQSGLQAELKQLADREQQALADIEQRRKTLKAGRQDLRGRLSWAVGPGAD